MKYIIIDPYKMTQDRWRAVVQERYSHCYKLASGDIIVKYKGYHPILFFGYTTHTNEQIREIIKQNEAN